MLRSAHDRTSSKDGSKLPSLSSLWTNQFNFHVADPDQADAMLEYVQQTGLGAVNANLSISCTEGWGIGKLARIVSDRLTGGRRALEADPSTAPSVPAAIESGPSTTIAVAESSTSPVPAAPRNVSRAKAAGAEFPSLCADNVRYIHYSFQGNDLDDVSDEHYGQFADIFDQQDPETQQAILDGTVKLLPTASSTGDQQSSQIVPSAMTDAGPDDLSDDQSDVGEDDLMDRLSRLWITDRMAKERKPLSSRPTDGPVTAARCSMSARASPFQKLQEGGPHGPHYVYSEMIDSALGPLIFVTPDKVQTRGGSTAVKSGDLLNEIASARGLDETVEDYTAHGIFAVRESDYAGIESKFIREKISPEQLVGALREYAKSYTPAKDWETLD